jgi:hypothetical protein
MCSLVLFLDSPVAFYFGYDAKRAMHAKVMQDSVWAETPKKKRRNKRP